MATTMATKKGATHMRNPHLHRHQALIPKHQGLTHMLHNHHHRGHILKCQGLISQRLTLHQRACNINMQRKRQRSTNREHMAEVGALAAGAFALYEGHEAKVDPEHARRHKMEAEIAGAAAVGTVGYAVYEHHEKNKYEPHHKHHGHHHHGRHHH